MRTRKGLSQRRLPPAPRREPDNTENFNSVDVGVDDPRDVADLEDVKSEHFDVVGYSAPRQGVLRESAGNTETHTSRVSRTHDPKEAAREMENAGVGEGAPHLSAHAQRVRGNADVRTPTNKGKIMNERTVHLDLGADIASGVGP